MTAPALVSTLVLTGCSPDYWPDLTSNQEQADPTPAAPTDPPQSDEVHPAVTVSQLKHIVSEIAAVAEKADKERDEKLAATRFADDALTFREALYKMKAKGKDGPLTIPTDFEMTLALPQATRSWPRSVLVVLQEAEGDSTKTDAAKDSKSEKKDDEKESDKKDEDATAPPVVLFLTQKSPRENYHVSYALQLLPNPNVPTLPAARDGGTFMPPDTKFLKLAPSDVGKAYADVLLKGDKSKWADDFSADGDPLIKELGAKAKETEKKDMPDTAELTYSNDEGAGAPLSMATNDSGAVVATDFVEYSTIKPVEESALVYNSDRGEALSGIESSSTGLQSTHTYQVLFYVPPENSNEKISLLGYARVMTESKEIE